jgi:hypothetical protein
MKKDIEQPTNSTEAKDAAGEDSVHEMVLQRIPEKQYDTGTHRWTHGRVVGWHSNGNAARWLLGPCPVCGSVTSNYGGAFSCHNDYCPCSADNFACSPGPVPKWWQTEIDVKLDGNMWCATRSGFVNLQESPAGFGERPWQAVDDLLQNVGREQSAPETGPQSK